METDVFFDIDGCLLTPEYRISTSQQELDSALAAARSNRMRLHINSNRSLESILRMRAELGLDGKVVFENGIGIWDPKEGMDSEGFAELDRELLADMLESYGFGCMFIRTDKRAEKAAELGREAVPGTRIAFCEKTRIYTSTIYPLRLPERAATGEDMEGLASHLSTGFGMEYDITTNYVYRNIIMIPKGAEKGKKVREIGRGRVASFGDETGDISMFRQSDICGCPSNAVDAVKQEIAERGGFISPSPYTKGACEFISYLIKNGRTE